MKYAILSFILSCCWTSNGMSQTAEKAAAVSLFDEARRLVDAGNYEQGCPKFAESNRLDPQLGALLHLADCYERQGKLASAWSAFREAAEMAEKRADPRSTLAQSRASALEQRVNRLTITLAPGAATAGLEVRRDDVPIGTAWFGVAVPVDPGRHQVTAAAPGHQARSRTVEFSGNGEHQTVEIEALGLEPSSITLQSATPKPSADVARVSDAEHTRPRAAWQIPTATTALALSAVGLGVGIGMQFKRSSKIDDRDAICPTSHNCTPQDQIDIDHLTGEARAAGKLSVASFIAAGTLGLGGLAILVFLPTQSTPSSTALHAPRIDLSLQGVRATYAF